MDKNEKAPTSILPKLGDINRAYSRMRRERDTLQKKLEEVDRLEKAELFEKNAELAEEQRDLCRELHNTKADLLQAQNKLAAAEDQMDEWRESHKAVDDENARLSAELLRVRRRLDELSQVEKPSWEKSYSTLRKHIHECAKKLGIPVRGTCRSIVSEIALAHSTSSFSAQIHTLHVELDNVKKANAGLKQQLQEACQSSEAWREDTETLRNKIASMEACNTAIDSTNMQLRTELGAANRAVAHWKKAAEVQFDLAGQLGKAQHELGIERANAKMLREKLAATEQKIADTEQRRRNWQRSHDRLHDAMELAHKHLADYLTDHYHTMVYKGSETLREALGKPKPTPFQPISVLAWDAAKTDNPVRDFTEAVMRQVCSMREALILLERYNSPEPAAGVLRRALKELGQE